MSNRSTSPALKTVTRIGGDDLTLAESFNVHTLAAAMKAARGESVTISVLTSTSLSLKVVA